MVCFSNPFSVPSDPKLDFRSQSLPRLYSQAIPSTSDEVDSYWSLYWTVFETSYDVLNLLTSADLAKALLSHPQNVLTLVRVTANRLEDILRNDCDFPNKSEVKVGMAAYAGNLLGKGPTTKGNDHKEQLDLNKQLLNCLRVLIRIVPFLLAQDDAAMEEELFWTNGKKQRQAKRDSHEYREHPNHFVIDDEEDEPQEHEPEPSSSGSKSPTYHEKYMDEEDSLPLAERLLGNCIDLLFVHNFTIPASYDGRKISYNIWENGIGSTVSLPATKEMDTNRCEVLRLLLVLLSKTLYIPSAAYYPSLSSSYEYAAPPPSTIYNRWHAHLVHPPPSSSAGAKFRKIQLSLLCSLLNTSLKSGAYYASTYAGLVGAVGGAVGDSYEKLVSGGKRKEDPPRLALVKLCIQTLNVLLVTPSPESLATERDRERRMPVNFVAGAGGRGHEHTRSPLATPAAVTESPNASYISHTSGQVGSSQQNTQEGINAFRLYLAKLHRSSDLPYIAEVNIFI